jgi:hypothetical protein
MIFMNLVDTIKCLCICGRYVENDRIYDYKDALYKHMVLEEL